MIDNPALSRLGFGVTGPHAGLGQSRRATHMLIREAVGLGMTLFDTGPAYGRGEGERRLGEALRGIRRDRVFLSTKAGIHAGGRRDFSAGAVEMSLKASLDRLRTDHVDLLLLHGPSPEDMSDKLLRRLQAFRERGMIRHIGVCGRGGELDAAIDAKAFDAIMAPLHPGLDEAALARLDRAKSAGLSVIGIETMAGTAGGLRLPLSRGAAWYAARRIKQMMTGRVQPPTDVSPAEALKWALARPACNAVICLTTRAANLEANARLAGLEPGRRVS